MQLSVQLNINMHEIAFMGKHFFIIQFIKIVQKLAPLKFDFFEIIQYFSNDENPINLFFF